MLGSAQFSAGQGLATASHSHPQPQPGSCRQGKGGREGEKERREEEREGEKKRGMKGGRERRGRVSTNDGAPLITPAGGIMASAGGDGMVRLLDTSGTEVRSGQRSNQGSDDIW